jgi:hypothetical protein
MVREKTGFIVKTTTALIVLILAGWVPLLG